MPLDLLLDNPYVWRILASILVILTAVVLTRLAKRLAARIVEEPARRYRLSKFTGRTAALLVLVFILAIWAPDQSAVITILTVVGAGIAISMREALLGFAGWVNLIVRAPYRPGDRVEINSIKGDVIDIRLLHTTLMEVQGWVQADQSTGRVVHIPNGWIFLYGVYNYNQGFNFVWHELPVTITFRSDWAKARELMLEMGRESAEIVAAQAADEIRRMSREYLVHYSILTPFVYVTITERGVQLTLRYLTEVRKRRGTEHAFVVSILDAFQAHNIELAPQTLLMVQGGTSLNTPLPPQAPPHSGDRVAPGTNTR